MAITVRDVQGQASTGASNTATFLVQPNAGDLIVSVCHHTSSSVPTPPAGYTAAVEETGVGGSHLRAYYKVAGASEPLTVTWNFAAPSPLASHVIYLVSGMDASPLDKFASGNSGNSSVTTLATGTTATTIENDELWLYVVGVRREVTGRSWTKGTESKYVEVISGSNSSVTTAHEIVSTTGAATSTMSWTGSGRAKALVVTWKASGALPSCAEGPTMPNEAKNRIGATAKTTALIPIDELLTAAPDKTCLNYATFRGGFYFGTNEMPAAHKTAGEAIGQFVAGLAKIGVVSIGFSNTRQIFSQFNLNLTGDDTVNTKLALANGALGSAGLRTWLQEPGFTNPNPWTNLTSVLTSQGMVASDVRVIWFQGVREQEWKSFPTDVTDATTSIVTLLTQLKTTYTNLVMAILSPRERAWDTSSVNQSHNPEPWAYQNAFAIQEVIRLQTTGDASMAFGTQGSNWTDGVVPWCAFGPYLWADGDRRNRRGGLQWTVLDVRGAESGHSGQEADYQHPSVAGTAKAGLELIRYMGRHPWTQPWFLKTHYSGF